MNASDMVRLLTWDDTGGNRNGRLYLPSEVEQYIPYRMRYDWKRFELHEPRKKRDIIAPSFLEMHYDELMRLCKHPYSGKPYQSMDTPMEDTELTAEDTKELDEFLNSFSRT